jgi:hypothetical protein
VPTVEEYTDPYLRSYAYVPPVSPGICEVCHVVVDGAWPRCWSCHQILGQIARPARIVVPISLYRGLEQLHHALRGYKDGRTDAVRDPLGMRVSATLGRFVRGHEVCLSGGDPFQVVTSVPSAKRQHPHPLETAILRVRALAPRFRRTLRPGSVEIKHLHAADGGFDVVAGVEDATVLLVDDTYTSGAALQSAASALYLAGARDVVGVTIGRFFNSEYSDVTRAFWTAVGERTFSFERCCLEPDPAWAWPPVGPLR